MKQQCATDANTLINNKQQEANTQWSYASQFHRGYTTVELKKSAFSPELNTCVAEIDVTVVQDGTSLLTTNVYDTVNNKTLAQILTPDSQKSSFVETLQGQMINNPTWADLADYETSIGL